MKRYSLAELAIFTEHGMGRGRMADIEHVCEPRAASELAYAQNMSQGDVVALFHDYGDAYRDHLERYIDHVLAKHNSGDRSAAASAVVPRFNLNELGWVRLVGMFPGDERRELVGAGVEEELAEEVARAAREAQGNVVKWWSGVGKAARPALLQSIAKTLSDYPSSWRRKEIDESSALRGSELVEAIQRGDVNSVRAFLETGVPVKGLESHGYTAMHLSVNGGLTEVCRLLLEHGADPFELLKTYSMPYTLLHRAADLEHIDICRLLVDAGLGPDYTPAEVPSYYRTAFQSVVGAGRLAAVEFFCEECGEDLDQRAFDGQKLADIAKKSPVVASYLTSLRIDRVFDAPAPDDEVLSTSKRSTGPSPL